MRYEKQTLQLKIFFFFFSDLYFHKTKYRFLQQYTKEPDN